MIQVLSLCLFLLLTAPAYAQPGSDAPPAAAGVAADVGAADAEGSDDADDEVFKHVVPVFDPGSHTRQICGMGFNRDQSKLITVGEDFTIQIWSVATGERLDILRLFPYGREAGDNPASWDVAAVSSDGRFVAVGGGRRISKEDERTHDRTKLVLVDLQRRTVRTVKGPGAGATALAFSPDGKRLAVAYRRAPQQIFILSDLESDDSRPLLRRKNEVLTDRQADKSPTILSFSPDGKHLLSAAESRNAVLWDTTPGQSRLSRRLGVTGVTRSFCWSPDGTEFIRTYSAFGRTPHGFEVRDAAGEVKRDFPFRDGPQLKHNADPWSCQYLDQQTVLLNTYTGGEELEFNTAAMKFDLRNGQAQRMTSEPSMASFPVKGAVSQDGTLAAITTAMGLDALVYRIKDGTVISRCGADSPLPSVVGWAAAGQPMGIAWSEVRKPGRNNTQPQDLQYAFNLSTMEPLGEIQPEHYVPGQLKAGDFAISRQPSDTAPNQFHVVRQDAVLGTFQNGNSLAATVLVPRPEADPLVAWSVRWIRIGGCNGYLSKPDGTGVAKLLPRHVFIRDMAPSPDGRFLLVSTGVHRMCLYTTDGSNYPLLNIARVHGEWVAWSPEGYYTASPGGEKMIGWAVANDANEFATFHTAEKFASHFRRPDLLQLAIELGSMERALKQTETRAPQLEKILPPRVELKLLKQNGNHVEIQGNAIAESPDKPVTVLRVLLDGRPLSHGVGYKTLKPGEPTTAKWELDIPPGSHELKLLARGDENSATSQSLYINSPKTADQQPTLHRLCVGIDQYKLTALNLTSAAKDAREIYTALEEYCVGADNRFGRAGGELIVNRDVSRSSVLAAINRIRTKVSPGDLFVIVFAGHGVKQDNEFYLLTHEANPNEKLTGKSLSGQDLREALKDIECTVLLVMDACHSARSVKSLRPVTNDLTRTMTDDATGVTVLAAAMEHEVATATEENGHFTAAFLKALKAGQGVPYDHYDNVLYTHHIYSVIFAEVRKATQGRQNPFLNMPWTIPPIGLREVHPPRE